MDDAFRFADELGPAKIIHFHEPSTSLKGVLVVDNVAAGFHGRFDFGGFTESPVEVPRRYIQAGISAVAPIITAN